VTVDTRRVVTAPASAANSPAERQRGAYAYSVNLRTGSVRALAAGVALMYFDPGCGKGDSVTLLRFLGNEEQQTAISVVSASTGRTAFASTYRGELTSAAQTSAGLLATRGRMLVRLSPHSARPVASFRGRPYEIRSSSVGADFLVATGSGKALVESVSGNQTSYDGWGGLYSTNLFLGANGDDVLAGAQAVSRGIFRRMKGPSVLSR
jgi:hypothetical protein